MISGLGLIVWTFTRMALMRRKGSACDALYVTSSL